MGWGISRRENFGTPPILVRGCQTRETSSPRALGSLWTISCVKLWWAKILEQHELIRKKKQGTLSPYEIPPPSAVVGTHQARTKKIPALASLPVWPFLFTHSAHGARKSDFGSAASAAGDTLSSRGVGAGWALRTTKNHFSAFQPLSFAKRGGGCLFAGAGVGNTLTVPLHTTRHLSKSVFPRLGPPLFGVLDPMQVKPRCRASPSGRRGWSSPMAPFSKRKNLRDEPPGRTCQSSARSPKD